MIIYSTGNNVLQINGIWCNSIVFKYSLQSNAELVTQKPRIQLVDAKVEQMETCIWMSINGQISQLTSIERFDLQDLASSAVNQIDITFSGDFTDSLLYQTISMYDSAINLDASLVTSTSSFYSYGGLLDDVLSTGAGNDILGGKAGDDILNGGKGADKLIGDEGNDQLYGGNGDDLFIFGGLLRLFW